MPKLVQEVESLLSKGVTAIETEIEADWAELKPAIVALGKSVEAQALQAAETLVSTGGNFGEAIGVLVASLPSDELALQTAVAGLLAGKVATIKAATPTAPAATPAQPAAS